MSTRRIATEIVLGGEKEFNSAMTAINSNLKTLRTDMAATSAEFDGNADSIDALTAKQKILAETAAQNDAKVDALRQRYEHLKATLGEDAAATDKAKQALNQAIVPNLRYVKIYQPQRCRKRYRRLPRWGRRKRCWWRFK